MIIADIQNEKVLLNLRNMQKFAQFAPQKRLLDVGMELLRLSQLEVPHDVGTLQNSGNVETSGRDVIVGYHEPYAARLHEHPEYRFQKGRKGKYLEDPLIRNQSTFRQHLRDGLVDDLKASIA